MAIVFEKCYGCISLKKGCLIIGYIQMVLTIIISIAAIFGIIYGSVIQTYHSKKSHNDFHAIGLFLVIVSSGVIMSCLHLLPFTIVLLVGLHQNNRGHVNSYLIFNVIQLVFFLMVLIIHNFVFTFAFVSFCQDMIAFSVAVYNYMVIRSYHIKMEENFSPEKGYNLS